MNNEHHEMMPPHELPAPEISEKVDAGNSLDSLNTTETSATKAVEQGMGASPVAAHQHAQQQSTNPLAATAAAGSKNVGGVGASPVIADDTDLIEREWVQKAKDIVAATSEDPYTQNKQMGHYKAVYVKKRFNKDIKVSE